MQTCVSVVHYSQRIFTSFQMVLHSQFVKEELFPNLVVLCEGSFLPFIHNGAKLLQSSWN